MTPDELRELREGRNLTREELATELGCSAGAIVQWELKKRTIPAWVGEKMLRNTTVELPLAELQQLMSWAIAHGKNFETILAEALNDYLAARGLSKPRRLKEHSTSQSFATKVAAPAAASPPTPAASQIPRKPTAKIVTLPRPTTPASDELKVAEAPAEYKFTKRKAK